MPTPEQARVQCRKVFESELIKNHLYLPSELARNGDYYKNDQIQFAWKMALAAWQAALKTRMPNVTQ